MTKKSKRELLLINALVLVGAIVLVEILLHLIFIYIPHPVLRPYASYHQLLRHEEVAVYQPHRYLGYIPSPGITKGANRHNSLGYRGEEIAIPKPASAFRIICIGGSTTYTVKVDDYRQSFPYLLEEKLSKAGFQNAEVINAGVGGWTSWESFLNYPLRLRDLSPDLLVIYHGINDAHARVVWPSTAFKRDNSGRRIAKVCNDRNPLEYLWRSSNIARIVQVALGLQAPASTFRSFDDYPASFLMYELDRQISEDAYPAGIFTQIPLDTMLSRNKPFYFRDNIRSLIDLARADSVDVMLCSFAYDTLNTNYVTREPAYRHAIDEQNEILRSLAVSTGVPFFDFYSRFPQDPDLYADAIHVNEDGSAAKAREFANNIISNFGEEILKRN